MKTEEYQKALLRRVRKVAPLDAEAVVRHIFSADTSAEVGKYVNGSDADIHALIDETKKSMEPKERSPGHEFPPPSWKSQSQSSDTSDRTQAASIGQVGTSQLPSSLSAPDDGTCDFLDHSFNSQGQSSDTSTEFQSAPTGQIVTSQIPVDRSIVLKEHLQSSSVQGCSNTSEEIKKYVNGSGADTHALIDETKKSMEPKAQSPGREFPPPSWKSQSQLSDTSDRTQAASVGQIGTSQLTSPSSAPDDGMCDFPDHSFNSQGQSSSTSMGFQSAPTGQIVTSHIPVDKSIILKEHLQSSSVQGCSNTSEEIKKYRKALLTRLLKQVQKVTSWNAEVIASYIITAHTPDKIEDYLNGSDADMHALIDETKKSMKARVRSRRHELLGPSLNSQGQPSETVEGIQTPPAGQIGNLQPLGSPSVPDDRMCDFLDPSSNSQGQSSSISVGTQAATGQIVTSQVPDDKSIDLKEHSQSSSVPGCSNVTECLPSSSRPCPFYISRRGFCKKGLSCEYSHGFGPSGKLEMEIREILQTVPYARVLVADLPLLYFVWYGRPLQVRCDWDPRGVPSLLHPLHTVCWIPDSYGQYFLVPQRKKQHFLVLVEHSQAYLGYSDHLRDWEALKEEGPNKIYIRFSDASKSICTRRNVYGYFSQYGPVVSVNIPNQSSFGFVRFQYPETVRLLLSEWNPQIPHFILGAAVHVYRYVPKGKAKLKNSSVKQRLVNRQPSHSQMEINPPEALLHGDVTGSPAGDSADHGQPSHSEVEIDHPEGGHVLDGLEINPVEGGQVPHGLEIDPVEGGQVPGGLDENPADEPIDDEIVPGLPDAGCFYKQS